MTGIYKITNKLTGKSYIGQSIHCGKRLDEHCRGEQFIDEIIQVEGIENFAFEILKKVSSNDLSFWEDYFIMKYDTMFPNGYNKRWNCGEDIRKQIKCLLSKEVSIPKPKMIVPTESQQLSNDFSPVPYVDLYSQGGKLFYLYCFLFHTGTPQNGIRRIKKRYYSFFKLEKLTKISDQTIKGYFGTLLQMGLIKETEEFYDIRQVTEITSFTSLSDCQRLSSKELYVLAKVRRENSYEQNDFYLKDLYWQKAERVNFKQTCAIRKAIEGLQEKGFVDVIYSERGGRSRFTRITSLEEN